MNPDKPATHAAIRPAAQPRVSAGHRLPLAAIVRDLAGWTPPVVLPAPMRQPASWQLA